MINLYTKLAIIKRQSEIEQEKALHMFDDAANPIPPRPKGESLYIQMRDYGPQWCGHYPEHVSEENRHRNYVTVSEKQIIQALGNGNEAKAVKKLIEYLPQEYHDIKATTMKKFVEEAELEEELSFDGLGISNVLPENEQNKKYNYKKMPGRLYSVSLANSKKHAYLFCGRGH